MKRDPSIHVTKSVLINILHKMGNSAPASVDMANQIFKRSKAKSVHTRSITLSSDKIEKKANKLTSSSRADADLFAHLIYARRRTLKHRGISRIEPSSKDWPILKGITASALEFSEEFNIPRRKAFILYIDIGISKMKKFMLNRFVNLYEDICERYLAMEEIRTDPDVFVTEEMFTYFNQMVIAHTGLPSNLKELPEQYVYFVRARATAEELNVNPEIYIRAQFAELDFTKTVPHPSQMVGIKASERVMRYCYTNGIIIKKPKHVTS